MVAGLIVWFCAAAGGPAAAGVPTNNVEERAWPSLAGPPGGGAIPLLPVSRRATTPKRSKRSVGLVGPAVVLQGPGEAGFCRDWPIPAETFPGVCGSSVAGSPQAGPPQPPLPRQPISQASRRGLGGLAPGLWACQPQQAKSQRSEAQAQCDPPSRPSLLRR